MEVSNDKTQFYWCPFARARDASEPTGVNRTFSGEPDNGCMCIGSRCMAWKPGAFSDTGRCGLVR